MVVARVSSDRARFLDDMLLNELHISRLALESPIRIGVTIGFAFLAGAFVPLLPYYLFSLKGPAVIASAVLSSAFLFAAGVWKGRIAKKSALVSGLETLIVGAAATTLLFLIGRAFTFI
jgi:predicted membrane protein (TIGR00267 family)